MNNALCVVLFRPLTETLRDVSPQENNNEQTHVHVPVSTGSDLTPTDSFASSSRTESDIGPSPTSEITVNGKQKQDSPKKTVVQNKAEPSTHTITSNQVC